MGYVVAGYALTLASLFLYAVRIVTRERALRRASAQFDD